MNNQEFLEMQTSAVDFSDSVYSSYDLVRFIPNVNDVSNVPTVVIEAKIGSDRYTDLSKAYLEVACQLVDSADATYAAADTASPHLLNAWAMFKDSRLEIEGSQVEYVLNPGTLNNMNNIRQRSKSNINSVAEIEGYYPIISNDISTNADLVDSAAYLSAAAYQDVQRGINKQFSVMLKLQDVFGFCSVSKVIRGGTFQVRLTKNTDFNDMLLKATATAAGRLKINRCDLWMPSITFNESLELSLAKLQTAQSPVLFDFQRSYVNRFAGLQQAANTIQVQSGVSNPRMILVGFKLTTSTGNQNASADNYFDPGMNRLYARVNGKILPLQPFEANPISQNLRGYHEFLMSDGKGYNEMLDSPVSFQEWSKSQCIWALDTSLYSETFGSLSGPAVIQIDYTLSAAANLDVDIVVLSDSHVKISELNGRIQIVEG